MELVSLALESVAHDEKIYRDNYDSDDLLEEEKKNIGSFYSYFKPFLKNNHSDDETSLPVYRHKFDGDELNFGDIKKGKRFDVISLLSTLCDDLYRRDSNAHTRTRTRIAVRAETLVGKYILLCCVSLPTETQAVNYLCDLSRELLSSEIDVEIVIIPNMKQGHEYQDSCFYRLFSTFNGCLTVPFHDYMRRVYICQYLDFHGEGDLKVIFVDPQLTVLQDDINSIVSFGNYGFPFTDDRISLLRHEFDKVSFRSVDDLLLCPTSFQLSSLSPNSESTVTLDQLRNKLVGLYLFMSGDKFSHFHKVQNQCREKGLEFEIVLVTLPYSQGVSRAIMIQYYVTGVVQMMRIDTEGLWLFPYKNSSCLRLLNLAKGLNFTSDAMIIVDPCNNITDFYGADVIKNLGIESYPFTREALVERYLNKKEEVTLESLLTYGSIDYVYRRNKFECDRERVTVTDLQGKNVVLYFDYPILYPAHFDKVVELYTEIKKSDSDFELVYISSPQTETEISIKKYNPEVKWLERPFDPKHISFLANHDAFIRGRNGKQGLPPRSLLAFGRDGHIYSIRAFELFTKYGLHCYPFRRENSDLRSEVIREISDQCRFMNGYEFPK